MKWMIIVLIMMSLVGSMMWVMPTQRQKHQAKLRTKAKTLGFQVQLEKITAPRAKGEMEPESKTIPAYRILREQMGKRERNNLRSWQVFRVESIADTGLPSGWSWSDGEGTFNADQLALLGEVIAALPGGVFSIESSPVYSGLFWDEQGDETELESLKEQILKLQSAGL